jgi:hypothetical protein
MRPMYVETYKTRRCGLGTPGSYSLTVSVAALRWVEPRRSQQLPVHLRNPEGSLYESILRSLTVP